MKTVYVCSPFRANELYTEKENIKNAIKYARQIIDQGDMPIVPHLMYPQILDDSKHEDREKGISFDLELIRYCNALYICGNYISEGMRREIEFAQQDYIDVDVKFLKI